MTICNKNVLVSAATTVNDMLDSFQLKATLSYEVLTAISDFAET